jgi:hypothetical protein
VTDTTPTTWVPVPATPYRLNVEAFGGLTIVVGPVGSSGAPIADVTAVFIPRNTSALEEVVDRITVVPGGTAQMNAAAVPLVGTVTWYTEAATCASCHHGRVSEPPEISGEIVKAPPAAEMRYESEDPDAVARVFIRVEYKGGRIREYQAKEPQAFKINDPESMSSMVMSKSRGGLPAGGGFVSLTRAVSSLRLSFTAHPRWNLHIRTEATAPAEFEGISYR